MADAVTDRIERVYAWERVAARKANRPGWRWCQTERITGGFLVTGDVPKGVYKTGKKAGRVRWGKAEDMQKIVVTDAEIAADETRYESETGACFRCCGNGDVPAGWSKENGSTFRPCPRCQGTGKPPAQDE